MAGILRARSGWADEDLALVVGEDRAVARAQQLATDRLPVREATRLEDDVRVAAGRDEAAERLHAVEASADRLVADLAIGADEGLEDAVEHSDVENLDVLTCGPDVSNPAEMLNSDRFSRLINKLSSEYERVLVDSPPVTTVTDAQILGALCKVTVVVLRAELSTRRMAIQAREALASVSAKVIGVVVNDVSSKGDRYGYSTGSYGYCYRHGADEGNGHRKARQLRRRETVPAAAVKLRNSKATTGESSIHGDADGR